MSGTKIPIGNVNGKSAYDHAVDGGYTGTEAQFDTLLAQAVSETIATATVVNGDLVVTTVAGEQQNLGRVVGEDGQDGEPGLDGANVLPTNEAVAQAVTQDGPTKDALSLTIGAQIDAALEDYTPSVGVLPFDIGDALSTQRPSHDGPVQWFTTVVDGVPLFAINGDLITEYSAVPVPDPTAFLDSYAGLLARWRADDLEASMGAVETLASRAGSTGAALTTPGASPTVETADGHKLLRFAGSASQYMDAALGNLNTPVTVVGVVDMDSAGRNVFGTGGNGGAYLGLAVNGGGTTIRMNTAADLGNGVAVPWGASTGLRAFVAVYVPGAGLSRFYYHALTATTGTTHPSTRPIDAPFRIASSYLNNYANLLVADMAVISGAIPDADAKTILNALAGYFGLTLEA